MSELAGTVSDPRIVGPARRLRALSLALEISLAAVVAGSVLAFGAVHPWAYVPLWCACFGAGALLAARTLTARSLRRRLGPRRLSLPVPTSRVELNPEPQAVASAWSVDLARPLLPRAPLLMPGLVFVGWVVLQLVPLPSGILAFLEPGRARFVPDEAGAWRPLTLAAPSTIRGLAFLASALLLHLVAATVLDEEAARRRFLRRVVGLGLLVALVGLAQQASGTRQIYWFFTPFEGRGATIFGPFVNRNHFAGYMLLVVPVALGALARVWRSYARRLGERPGLRRALIALESAEGTALIYATLPVFATIAALFATTSRGALLAFLGSLAVTALASRSRTAMPVSAAAVAFLLVAAFWFGTERLEQRLARAPRESALRTAVWKDSIERMEGLWLTGSGFNTFASSMSRTTPWALPAGATPWPAELLASGILRTRSGFRTPAEGPSLTWYREAHNDYLQVLVETGVPGLLVALWGALAVVARARRSPWLLAALGGVLLHELVDFDLQLFGIAALFVALAAVPPEGSRAERSVAAT